MQTTDVVRSDAQIKRSIEAELEWTPGMDEAAIGVAVRDGCVRLTGDIESYQEKARAVGAVSHVRGVRAVVDDISVRPAWKREASSDTTLAREIADVLRSHSDVPASVFGAVDHGAVTLYGEAEWQFQREVAQQAVAGIRNLVSVSNRITLLPRPSSPDAHERIREALLRNARIDAENITVSGDGTTVKLEGPVRSLDEKAAIIAAAWASPHVAHVEDALTVEPRRDGRSTREGLDV